MADRKRLSEASLGRLSVTYSFAAFSPYCTSSALQFPISPIFLLIALSLLALRCLSTTDSLAPGENVVVPLIANSLEWTLSSPPPLHQFIEPPLVVETEHLELHPGKEAEEVLAMQGHQVTDIIGKEGWTLNDPEKYEGLIPQNAEWTEFVNEKTGEWVYLDEYGNKVEKP